jgi:hypothetical protein
MCLEKSQSCSLSLHSKIEMELHLYRREELVLGITKHMISLGLEGKKAWKLNFNCSLLNPIKKSMNQASHASMVSIAQNLQCTRISQYKKP